MSSSTKSAEKPNEGRLGLEVYLGALYLFCFGCAAGFFIGRTPYLVLSVLGHLMPLARSLALGLSVRLLEPIAEFTDSRSKAVWYGRSLIALAWFPCGVQFANAWWGAGGRFLPVSRFLSDSAGAPLPCKGTNVQEALVMGAGGCDVGFAAVLLLGAVAGTAVLFAARRGGTGESEDANAADATRKTGEFSLRNELPASSGSEEDEEEEESGSEDGADGDATQARAVGKAEAEADADDATDASDVIG